MDKMGEMDKMDKMDKKHESTKARRHEKTSYKLQVNSKKPLTIEPLTIEQINNQKKSVSLQIG